MTPSSLNNLTDAEKRVRIAEACGWEDISSELGIEYRIPNRGGFVYVKDPLNDLNACHEMEATLNPVRIDKAPLNTIWYTYVRHLLRIVERDGTSAMHATAAQRAEAFLDTIAP